MVASWQPEIMPFEPDPDNAGEGKRMMRAILLSVLDLSFVGNYADLS